MNKKLTVFSVILLMAVIFLFCYLTNPQLQEFVATYTEEDFFDENIYSDMEHVAKRLEEEIMKGTESFTIYLKDMDVSEINEINEFLDGVYGSGATYQQVGTIGNTYQKVMITVDRTTNYYAIKAYLNQETIPDSEQKAHILYKNIKQIMDENINESMTDFEKEVALHDYLVRNCKYSEDISQPAESDIYRAYGALVNGEAVCNGYAEALQLLLMCAGIESEFVVGTADGEEHAWNLVQIDGKWYHLDATWNDPLPDKQDIVVHSYFNVTDEIISKNHTWEKENYPTATSMDYNYYVYNNLYFENFERYKEEAYVQMVNEKNNHFEAAVENYVENEKDMQFLFENNDLYSAVNWQTVHVQNYCVVIMQAE